MCCMPLNPFNKCFRAAATKKNPIFCQKMAKNCQFLAQISVLRVHMVSLYPLSSMLRVLDSKKYVAHAIEPISQVFQCRHHQKNTIFRPKMAKKCQFLAQISVFWVRLVGLCSPPLFRGCRIQNKMCGMPLTPFDNRFRAIFVIRLCLGAYRKPIFLVLHLKIKLFPMFSIKIDLVGKYRTQATATRQRT